MKRGWTPGLVGSGRSPAPCRYPGEARSTARTAAVTLTEPKSMPSKITLVLSVVAPGSFRLGRSETKDSSVSRNQGSNAEARISGGPPNAQACRAACLGIVPAAVGATVRVLACRRAGGCEVVGARALAMREVVSLPALHRPRLRAAIRYFLMVRCDRCAIVAMLAGRLRMACPSWVECSAWAIAWDRPAKM